jgi:predicted secreted protein
MALAGNAVKISCADTDVAGDEIDGIQSIDWGEAIELLDTTDTMDTSAAHTRIMGLKDLKVSLSGDYESADTGQARLVTNGRAGTTTYVRFLPNGSAGFKCACKIENLKVAASFDGKVTFSCDLVGTGAVGTV